MILTIDIGNTQTCFGLFEANENEPKFVWRSKTDKAFLGNDIYNKLSFDASVNNFSLSNICSVSVSCVVPNLLNAWESCVDKISREFNTDVKFVVCNPKNVEDLNADIYDCKYAKPDEVGGDIISTCIAAKSFLNVPCAIVDFGTATNINVINKMGEFIGASIAPGLHSSLNALIGDASALSDIVIKAPEKVIGNSTTELIQSGVVYGEAGKVDGLLSRIEDELGYSIDVYCTGGWASLISKYMNHKNKVYMNLVLQGLKVFSDNFDA